MRTQAIDSAVNPSPVTVHRVPGGHAATCGCHLGGVFGVPAAGLRACRPRVMPGRRSHRLP